MNSSASQKRLGDGLKAQREQINRAKKSSI
jgi:hypothetical protein